MSRFVIAALMAATALGAAACSSGYSNSSPTAPGGGSTSTPPPDAIIINIVGINGAQSFSPNPATVPAGRMVVWHNTDTITHRVVFNDGELDTGNVAPGAFTAAMSLVANGGYHCSIHPVMIGATSGQ